MRTVAKLSIAAVGLVLCLGLWATPPNADASKRHADSGKPHARSKRSPRATDQIYVVLKAPDVLNVGKRSIWAVSPGGKGLQRIRGGNQSLTISPDGRYLYCRCSGRRDPAVERMNADGSGIRKIFPLSGFDPPGYPGLGPNLADVSLSGVGTITYPYQSQDGLSHIDIMGPDGGAQTVYSSGNNLYAAYLSPDGQSIAFYEQGANDERSIQLLNVTTGLLRTLYVNPPVYGYVDRCARPETVVRDFSADSRKLALVTVIKAECAAGGDAALGVRIVDIASGVAGGLTLLPAHGSGPLLSPDGSQIAFVGHPATNFRDTTGLYVINSDGSGLRRVLPRNPMPALKVEFALAWGKVTLGSSPDAKCVRKANRAFRKALRRAKRLRSGLARRRAKRRAARARRARLKKCRT